MIDPSHPVVRLVREDRRYKFEAYAFVFDALRYAHEKLGLGISLEEGSGPEPIPPGVEIKSVEEATELPERHVSGQELCHAMRLLALEQFGYMAKCVLNSWGVYSTGDFGEIVFNLIKIGQMKKTDGDKREDFNDVFDFDEGLTESFRIQMTE